MSDDSPLRWVRRTVFEATQDQMAEIGGVSRPRVSRYETVDPPPFDFLKRVREAAIQRGLPFSGDWFFQVPANPDDEGAQ